ncbi:hypothetical protein JRQ81_007641 [Phrynocephalus forsythii]|uniref:Leucine-rich repeat-containing protein 74B n=1 Tax=Phrynocephalus forsythii TaxID=171643 RepID=A0A9Q1ATM1_9SAUR|nr:hypothetical protein JRQ81_007641 [Phrynocephalus forsythii]
MPKPPLSPVPEQEADVGGRLSGSQSPSEVVPSGGAASGASAGLSTWAVEPQAEQGESSTSCTEHEEDGSTGDSAEDENGEEQWDTDLEIEESRKSYDPAGKAKYLDTCQTYGVVPISYFVRHMKDSELTLTHHGLSPKAAKAVALSLTNNTSVAKLNLSDNGLGGEGTAAIAEMMMENCFISDLDLSENRSGLKGAIALSAMLRTNTTLMTLKLSGNELKDDAAKHVAEALVYNNKVASLDLSGNMLGEAAGEVLGAAIAENVGLKELDLSWNYFRGQGAVAIAKGLGSHEQKRSSMWSMPKANIFLRVLDLSYNGFGNSGAAALGEALKVNNVLEELHVGNNRISLEGALGLGLGLKENKALKSLCVPRNPIPSEGCTGILKALRANPGTVLEFLDFSEVVMNQEFVGFCAAVQDVFPSLQIKHDGTSRSFRTDPAKGSREDPEL